jgi:probable DNA repair protein
MLEKICNLNELLRQNSVIVTPNARLTKSLIERIATAQETKKCWPTPSIQPFNIYLQHIWQQYYATNFDGEPRTILSDFEDDYIWLKCINEKQQHTLHSPNLALNIKQAWGNCKDWLVQPFSSQFHLNPETRFFINIVEKYLQKKKTKLHTKELLEEVTQLLQQKKISLPTYFIFALFDEFTPAQQQLIDTIAQYHPHTQLYLFDEPSPADQKIYRVSCSDEDNEIKVVTQWLHQQSHTAPSKTIAVVAPQLQNIRDKLERQLLSYFKPEDFNISLGKSLNTYELSHTCLALLTIADKYISQDTLHCLAYSSYVKDAHKEKQLRGKIFQKLNKLSEPFYNRNQVLNDFEDTSLKYPLKNSINLLSENKQQPFSHWLTTFEKVLVEMGFPGEHALSSEEYQIHNRLMLLLKDLKKYIADPTPCELHSALELLQWNLNKVIFQPQASSSTKIHILGWLEALGLPFDAIWIMGVDEQTLPQKLNPSPFIPFEIQQSLQMPHASDQRENVLTDKHIQRLSKQSSEIIFSHAIEADGAERQICHPCLQFNEIKLNEIVMVQSQQFTNFTTSFQPNYQIPFKSSGVVKGGSYLVKEQAQCPFRAFTKFRLNIKDAPAKTIGLTPLEKGVLLHSALEHLWQQLQDQKNLIELSEQNKLLVLIENTIDRTLSSLKKKKPYTFQSLFTQLEKNRLKRIVEKYLIQEMQRAPFQIYKLEYQTDFQIGSATLSLRIDRIDETEDGSLVAIDYKTGQTTISEWFEDRLLEPQLPMYALSEQNISSLLYAQLHQRAIQNKGLTNEAAMASSTIHDIAKYDISWEEQKMMWYEKISYLLSEFLTGNSLPTPHKKNLCDRCQYSNLCGLNR